MGVAATLAACGSGCALFDTGGWTAAGTGVRQTLLKPIDDVAPQALRLEYVILERPVIEKILMHLRLQPQPPPIRALAGGRCSR